MKTAILLATILGVLSMSTGTHGAGLVPKIVSATDTFVASTSSSPDIATALKMFTSAFKRIMPCGYAPFDIPALAPFSMQYWPFHFNNQDLQINGNVSNLVISGLNSYRWLNIAFDANTNRITFDVDVSEIQVLGEYMVDFFAMLAGWPVTSPGEGILNLKVTDLRLVGEFTLASSPTNPNGLVMSDVHMNLYLADVVSPSWNSYWNIALNNYINKFIHDINLMLVEQLQPVVDINFNELALPVINNALENVSMAELIEFFVNNANLWNSVTCNVVA